MMSLRQSTTLESSTINDSAHGVITRLINAGMSRSEATAAYLEWLSISLKKASDEKIHEVFNDPRIYRAIGIFFQIDAAAKIDDYDGDFPAAIVDLANEDPEWLKKNFVELRPDFFNHP